MAQVQKRNRKNRRRRGKIRISSSARLVERNDATRTAKPDTTRYPKKAARPPADVAPTFKIKIRKK